MYTLPKLPFDSLGQFIDANALKFHHGKHHAAYVSNLNKALEQADFNQDCSIEQLLQSLAQFHEPQQTAIRNFGGGHANHKLFWEILSPKQEVMDIQLIAALNHHFGSIENFKKQFEQAALGVFGSGWVWLILDLSGKLVICTTQNQDSPLMALPHCPVGTPLLTLDMWEHAYYLQYQNRRADFIPHFWDYVSWPAVEQNYLTASKALG